MPNNSLQAYTRLVGRCKTRNQLRRVQIGFENRLTPEETQLLLANNPFRLSIAGKLGARAASVSRRVQIRRGQIPTTEALQKWMIAADTARWLNKCAKLNNAVAVGPVKSFIRRKLAPTIRLYSGKGQVREKTLIIGFAGNSNRLMLPISIFLQALPHNAFDLLLIWDPTRNGFSRGIPAMGSDIESLCSSISALAQPSSYPESSSIGTSSGGIAAIMAAQILGLGSALAVGCQGTNSLNWRHINLRERLQEGLANRSLMRPQIHIVHGADSVDDSNAADSIENTLPLKRTRVASRDSLVLHNPLIHLLEEGNLTPLLASSFSRLA